MASGLVGDYLKDPQPIGKFWWKPRTTRQRNISIAITVFLFLILAISLFYFAFAFRFKQCNTVICKEVATEIIKHIDKYMDPCQDFYRFACGNFIRNVDVRDRGLSIEEYAKEGTRVKIRSLLEEDLTPDDPKLLTLAKKLYRSCMDEGTIEAQGTKEIFQVFKYIGGWPAVERGPWQEENYNWVEAIHRLRKLGIDFDVFFRVSVDKDRHNDMKYILGIHDMSYSPSELSQADRKLYLNYMVDVATMFGANRYTATQHSEEVLNLFLVLASISKSSARNNRTNMYEKLSISELQYHYEELNWPYYIKGVVGDLVPVRFEDEVVLTDPDYLIQLGKLLSRTPKRTLANFIAWHTVQYLINFLPTRILDKAYDFLARVNGHAMKPLRWKMCVKTAEDRLDSIIAAVFIRRFLDAKVRDDVVHLIKNVKDTFKTSLLKLEWFDQQTKQLIMSKLLTSVEKVASVGDLIELEIDNERTYYDADISNHTFMAASLYLDNIRHDKMFMKLINPVDDNMFANTAFITGTRIKYLAKKNILIFPVGIFEGIFYKRDRPAYMNYAILGSTVGHEVSHIFMRARHGLPPSEWELRSFWTPSSLVNYQEKLNCLAEQYGKLAADGSRKSKSPLKTGDEDMADLAGMEISYDTYVNLIKQNGAEPTLPGLNYSTAQLFWISSAMHHCSRYPYTEKDMENYGWSPVELRVNGPLQNIKEFADDFGCPVGSKMNPDKKCDVW
nr:unnamed protein product [Callosobruchus chinensis]